MSKNNEVDRRLGRDEEIDSKELLRRYAALKRFLEDNWGRVGLLLPRVRKPENLKVLLNRIPGVQWLPAFRDFPAGCLLREGSKKVEWREVRVTRLRCNEADTEVGRLSSESHTANQAAQDARRTFNSVSAEIGGGQRAKAVERRLQEIAGQLRLSELEANASKLANSFREAQARRQARVELLSQQEAWLSRNELLEFINDVGKRYRKTPANFAKAMAGLPYYDWLYSIRKCQTTPSINDVKPTYLFQVFELLTVIVKRTKPANRKEIEKKLKKHLLKESPDSPLRNYFSPYWHYMTVALSECRGKKLAPDQIPFKAMEKCLDHFHSPGPLQSELAKYNRLA